jgi:hypothetical protein
MSTNILYFKSGILIRTFNNQDILIEEHFEGNDSIWIKLYNNIGKHKSELIKL